MERNSALLPTPSSSVPSSETSFSAISTSSGEYISSIDLRVRVRQPFRPPAALLFSRNSSSFSEKSLRIFRFPLRAHSSRGLCPRQSETSMLALCRSSSSTTSLWHSATATCSAVRPPGSAESGLTPAASRSRTRFTLPSQADRHSSLAATRLVDFGESFAPRARRR